MKIHSLLNPCRGDERDGYRGSESPTPAPMPRPMAPYTSVPKRQKIPKDAPVFSESAQVVGHVNYPPHEVFQYTYKVPGDDKEYVVVWDYNVGLVRMTPFFKSLKHTKTIPAKALRENPGLKDVSYSITGGALVCQGYWMPYQAAKAIAATFCWHIRWVLTPVFGYDFPEMCFHPEDPRYGRFLIAPEIVQECIDETNRFREEGCDYRIASQMGSTTVETPQLPTLNAPWEPMSHHPRKSEESGYYTGGDQNERSTVSPQVSPRGSTWISAWTSVNGSKSPSSSPIVHSPTCDRTANELPPLHQHLREYGVPLDPRPTSVPRGYYDKAILTKRPHSEIVVDDNFLRRSPIHPHNIMPTPQPIDNTGASNFGNRNRTHRELEAAEIILQLSVADQELPAPKRPRHGSQYWRTID
ncbi:uncharacterized protein N0V89_001228 [Didymosphaeria variabile]|uniref:HTH APSES-type domain-containing protein n=1 Tax=Didymosphaeria variabile TaxID=1932322 RepID=A0A9W9CGI2_9PLEO|nr:uncharacterized protein N0V89_001228 [Didymosphaeria variabile]KAJ4360662.1 hypothetical protein N0V89_001228 [Didymosphaeria variabile]